MEPTAVAQYVRTLDSKYIGCTEHELDEEFETITCLELPPPAPGGEDCRFRPPGQTHRHLIILTTPAEPVADVSFTLHIFPPDPHVEEYYEEVDGADDGAEVLSARGSFGELR